MAKKSSTIVLQQNMEKLMIRHKLRLIPLAKKSGLSKGLLWNLTTNPRANPTLDTLDALAGAFGLSAFQLLMP